MFERILIEKHKAIFFVISKNACTSMKAHLVHLMGMEKHEKYPNDVHIRHLYKYYYPTEKEILGKYKSYFKYSFVRNPWSRLVSCYKNRIVLDSDEINSTKSTLLKTNPEFRSDMSFEEFIDVVCEIPDSKADQHFRSQLFELTGRKDKLLVNYIGHLEKMGDHLKQIAEYSGLPFSDFPKVNTTNKRKSYQDFYTPETIEKVRQRFKADIDFFNYEFENEAPVTSVGFVDNAIKEKLSKAKYLPSILEDKKNLPPEKIEPHKKSISIILKDFLHRISNLK